MNYPVMEKQLCYRNRKYIAICLPKHLNCKSLEFCVCTLQQYTLLEKWLQHGFVGFMYSSKSTEKIPVQLMLITFVVFNSNLNNLLNLDDKMSPKLPALKDCKKRGGGGYIFFPFFGKLWKLIQLCFSPNSTVWIEVLSNAHSVIISHSKLRQTKNIKVSLFWCETEALLKAACFFLL